MRPTPNTKCESCLFWEAGECRRFPPQVAPWPEGNEQPVIYMPFPTWPHVALTDWCGEYRRQA